MSLSKDVSVWMFASESMYPAWNGGQFLTYTPSRAFLFVTKSLCLPGRR